MLALCGRLLLPAGASGDSAACAKLLLSEQRGTFEKLTERYVDAEAPKPQKSKQQQQQQPEAPPPPLPPADGAASPFPPLPPM